MPSIEPLLIWVYGTPVRGYDVGSEMKTSVVTREDEPLGSAVARGAQYLLLDLNTNRLINIWFESMDFYEYERFELLMDGEFPGRLSESRQRP